MDPQTDAMSDTHAELKMIVTLVPGQSHSSSRYLPLLNDNGRDNRDGGTRRNAKRGETHKRLRALKPPFRDEAMPCQVFNANNGSPRILELL